MTIVSITTVRAQRLAQYPKTVLELADLLGILPEAVADRRMEAQMSLARRLADAMLTERQRGDAMRGGRTAGKVYSFDRHMDLAEALGVVLYGIATRGPELSEAQMRETVELARRIAA